MIYPILIRENNVVPHLKDARHAEGAVSVDTTENRGVCQNGRWPIPQRVKELANDQHDTRFRSLTAASEQSPRAIYDSH